MTETEFVRTNAGIDPTLHFWGWEIPVYLFLGGMAAGILVLAALRMKTTGRAPVGLARFFPFAAIALIGIGMGALFLDLAHKLYVWRFYFALRPGSPMSWGAWILIAVVPAALLLGLPGITARDMSTLKRLGKSALATKLLGYLEAGQSFARSNLELVCNLAIVAGVALGFYTGVLIGTIGARPAWSSLYLAPLFLVSGISAGAAVMTLFASEHAEHEFLRKWDILAISLELVFLALYFIGLATNTGANGAYALSLFFGGPFTATFWVFVVGLGLLVPLAIALFAHDEAGDAQVSQSSGTFALAAAIIQPRMIAPILILIGGFVLRLVIIRAGQA